MIRIFLRLCPLLLFPIAAEAKPNLLVILSDDMGFSDLGCYGGEIRTPNLDALASKGIRFTQFYNGGRCCPTRASLLTGLYPHQTGIGHMMENRGLPSYQGDLNTRCVTLAEALKPAGYRTYMIGKWHVTPAGSAEGPKHNWPLQRGFDRFYGTIHGGGSLFDPNTLTRGNTFITPANDPNYQPNEPWYYTDAISDNTVAYLREHAEQHADQPFLAYVAYTAAHWPMHAPEKEIAKYRGHYDSGYLPVYTARLEKMKRLGLIDPNWQIPEPVGDWSKVSNKPWEARCMEVYAAMVDRMDQGIGKIVATLRDTGQLENTLVVFLQDNGGCAEEYGRTKRLIGPLKRPEKPTLPAMGPEELQTQMIPVQSRDGYPLRRGVGVMPGPPETAIGYGEAWANVSNTPFRLYKHYVHEGGISTPLIMHWPAGIHPRNSWYREPAHLIDLMPTFLELAGSSYPKGKTPLQGVALTPAFRGEPLNRKQPIFFEHEGNRAIRDGTWKLVAKGEKGPWELYDIDIDRTEQHDVIARHPRIAEKMAAQWQEWADRVGVVPFGSWTKR